MVISYPLSVRYNSFANGEQIARTALLLIKVFRLELENVTQMSVKTSILSTEYIRRRRMCPVTSFPLLHDV
jgi:hypothetical protein